MAETSRRRRPAAVRDEKAAEARREASGREARRRASARPSREDPLSDLAERMDRADTPSELTDRLDLLSKRLSQLEWRIDPPAPYQQAASFPVYPTDSSASPASSFPVYPTMAYPTTSYGVRGTLVSNGTDVDDGGDREIDPPPLHGKRSSPVIETFNELERRIDTLHQQISSLQGRLEPALTGRLTDAPEPDGGDTSPERLGGSYLADRLSNTVEVIEAAIFRLAGLERALEL